ncbi:MAG: DsbC family protein [Thauera sp.]|jgi:thiol:disulfide interchange protein DsbC|nr:DsbC family protein [Thauera sp.]
MVFPVQKRWSKALLCSLGLSFAVGGSVLAHASEQAVEEAMNTFIGRTAVESVRAMPYANLYEVLLSSGELVYTDDKVSFILDGSVIDAKTRRDVTQERRNELSAIDFSTLPLERAVKLVRGKGTRVIATFEDPNCGYCKKLVKDLAKMDDVTIYTFLYPILSEDSASKSNNIWCAKDSAQSWWNWMVDGKQPADADCDVNAVLENVALGRKLRITGTPTIFLADGSRIGGYMPPASLEEAINEAAKKQTKPAQAR